MVAVAGCHELKQQRTRCDYLPPDDAVVTSATDLANRSVHKLSCVLLRIGFRVQIMSVLQLPPSEF